MAGEGSDGAQRGARVPAVARAVDGLPAILGDVRGGGDDRVRVPGRSHDASERQPLAPLRQSGGAVRERVVVEVHVHATAARDRDGREREGPRARLGREGLVGVVELDVDLARAVRGRGRASVDVEVSVRRALAGESRYRDYGA